MGVAMAAFAVMGYFYHSVDNPDADDEEEKSHEMLEKEKMAFQNKALADD